MPEVQGYCVKCRQKRVMKNPADETMANGRLAVRGTCSVCGTKMFKIKGMKTGKFEEDDLQMDGAVECAEECQERMGGRQKPARSSKRSKRSKRASKKSKKSRSSRHSRRSKKH